MKRSQRMQKLVDIETQQSQHLIGQFKADQDALKKQKGAMANLVTYRDEYATRFKQTGDSGISAFRYHDFSCFLQKLDDAITQQREVLKTCEANLNSSREAWQVNHRRIEALQQVTDQSQSSENAQSRKRIQRGVEERFGRLATTAFSS